MDYNVFNSLNTGRTLSSADKQMFFQERMSSTAHQREVEDLKRAGLNPVLSAGGAGAQTTSGAMDNEEASFDNPLYKGFEKAMNGLMTSVNNNAKNNKVISDMVKQSYDTLRQSQIFNQFIMKELKDTENHVAANARMNNSDPEKLFESLLTLPELATKAGVNNNSSLREKFDWISDQDWKVPAKKSGASNSNSLVVKLLGLAGFDKALNNAIGYDFPKSIENLLTLNFDGKKSFEKELLGMFIPTLKDEYTQYKYHSGRGGHSGHNSKY